MTPASPPPPNMNDILTAMSVMMSRPAPAEDKSLTRTVITGATALIGAIMLALIFWVGSSVNSLSTTVTRMSANVDQLQASIADLRQGQTSTTTQLADAKASAARQDARLDAQDADVGRLKERVRILEGQKPLDALPANR